MKIVIDDTPDLESLVGQVCRRIGIADFGELDAMTAAQKKAAIPPIVEAVGNPAIKLAVRVHLAFLLATTLRADFGPLLHLYDTIGPFAHQQDRIATALWQVGDGISRRAGNRDARYFDRMAALLRDADTLAPQMLAVALVKIKSRREDTIRLFGELLSQRDHPCLGHIAMACRRLKAPETIPALTALLDHPWVLVSREARKALKAMGAIHANTTLTPAGGDPQLPDEFLTTDFDPEDLRRFLDSFATALSSGLSPAEQAALVEAYDEQDPGPEHAELYRFSVTGSGGPETLEIALEGGSKVRLYLADGSPLGGPVAAAVEALQPD